MKKHASKWFFILLAVAVVIGMGSCALFGTDGPTYLGVDWDGSDVSGGWTFPYPFNTPGLWGRGVFYEVEPATYYFWYYLPDYGYTSDDYYLKIEADSGSFPFGEGVETYFGLYLAIGGPELYYGDHIKAESVLEPDGSWTATASYGGRTATLKSIANMESAPSSSYTFKSR